MGAFNIMPREQQEKKIKMKFCILFSLSILKAIELNRQQYLFSGYRTCIYLLSIEEAQPRALIDSIRTELQPRLGSRPLMALACSISCLLLVLGSRLRRHRRLHLRRSHRHPRSRHLPLPLHLAAWAVRGDRAGRHG